MSIFDRIGELLKKEVNPNVFGYLTAREAPSMKASDYVKAYKGWVYTCTNAIAEEVASMQLHLQQQQDGSWIEVTEHIVIDLLQDVNDFNTFNGLLTETSSFLELDGNGFWYLPRGEVTNKPTEIWFLNPTKISVVKSKEKVISGYVMTTKTGEKVPLTTDEIIHFKRFNPLSRYRGMGTVQASAMAIDADTFSAQWNKNFFYNSAMPSSVLETDEELTDEQYDRLKEQWDSRFRGLDNAHKMAILQGGLKYKPAQLSQRDMDYLNQRRFSRDEILAVFRVPKTIIGITEDVNRANAEASEYVFSKRVIKPKMRFIVDHLNEFLLPMFDMSQDEWRFVFDDPVPENRDLELKEYENGIKNYWLTSNEIRDSEGLPPVSGGDSIYVPFSLYPIGSTEEKGVEKQTKQMGDVQRDDHIKKVEKRRRILISEIEKLLPDWLKLYRKLYDQVVKRLIKFAEGEKSIKKGRVDDLIALLFATETQDINDLKGVADKSLRSAFVRGGRQAFQDLDWAQAFSTDNDRASQWLANNALREAKTINNTLKSEIRKILSEGVKEGKSTLQIADDINRIKKDTAKFKAERIARTEVTRAYSEGVIEAWKQTSLVTHKRWITVGDDRVEQDCAGNEAEGAIPFDQPFSSGAMTPADEHINCRCSLQSLSASDLTFSVQEEAGKILKIEKDKLKKDIAKELKLSKDRLGKEADEIVGKAKVQADSIVKEATKEAKKEKKKIIGDLAKLRDDAMKQLYD